MPSLLRRPGAHFLSACASLALATACRDSAAAPAAPDQELEERTIQVTVWSERHELFVEYPVPVAGEPIVLVTHVTDHRTTRPRTAGPVVFRFASPGGGRLEHTEEEPARAGIYLPEILLPTTGPWNLEIEVPAPPDREDDADRIPLPAIEVFATAGEAAAAEIPEAPEGIAFLKEQQWRLGTRIQRVDARAITEHVCVPATVLAAPERTARVSPPVAGALVPVADGDPLRIGREVEEGELLAYLRPPLSDLGVELLRSEAEVERTRLALDLAQAAHERTAALFEERARSKRELEEAEFALGVAQAEHEAAVAVVRTLLRSGLILQEDRRTGGPALPLFELRAPIAGRVTHVHAALGEHVREERTIVEILDASRVHVEAHVRTEELARVTSFDEPRLRTLRSPAGPPSPLPPGGARLLTVGLEVDPDTQTIPLLYEADNAARRLFIGMGLEVLLPVGAPDAAPVVPTTALVEEAGESVVYVQLGGEAFEKRHVELGARDAGHVQVLSGLEPGERVVVEGAYAVRLASASGALPAHGHHH